MNESDVLLAVKVWIAAAWADGVVVDQESEGIKSFIAAAKLTDEERATALGWLENKITLDDVDLDKISPSDRSNIYAAAVTIVGIDDEVVPDEEQFLERLQGALEIDEQTAKALRG